MNTILKILMKMIYLINLIEYCKLYKNEIKSDKKDKIKKSLTLLKK